MANYQQYTFNELDTIAKTADKQRWIIAANNAFYANANIQPKQPGEMIPLMYRPKKQVKKVSVEEFFKALDGFKDRNRK